MSPAIAFEAVLRPPYHVSGKQIRPRGTLPTASVMPEFGPSPRQRLRLRDRLAGAVWGHLVGDALGLAYERTSPELVDEVRWSAVGAHGQVPGTWSDDGGLMLALLDSLLHGFDLEDQARRAVAWMDGPDYKTGPRF